MKKIEKLKINVSVRTNRVQDVVDAILSVEEEIIDKLNEIIDELNLTKKE